MCIIGKEEEEEERHIVCGGCLKRYRKLHNDVRVRHEHR